ncbi:hypothetical protein [Kocuria sp. U4B]
MDDRTIARAQARLIREGLRGAGFSVMDLWWWTFRLGGDIGEVEVDAFLHHAPALRNQVVCAANHLLGGHSVPYTWEMSPDTS